MKKATKLILTLTISIMTMLCLSISASALTEGDWEFQLLDNEVMITGYIGTDTDIVVPDTIYGCPVTSMEMEYDRNLSGATSIIFPKNLKEVNSSVVGSALISATLPEGLEKIGYEAFARCTNLKDVNIPSTVTEIDSFAFYECSSLTEVTFSENIKKLGAYSFDSSGIKEVYIPYIEELDAGIFGGCNNLKKVTFAQGHKTIPANSFLGCSHLTEISIPSTVEDIGDQAFHNCTSLKKIILPVSLKRLGGYAFAGTSIVEIVIPYGTHTIDSYAFRANSALKSVYIPDSVTYMGSDILYESNNAIIYCTTDSYAAQNCKEEKNSYLTDNSVNSGITVLYNGTRISFHSYGQNPEILESRTLVPLRSIFEAMGAEVSWDQATQTAIAVRDGITIKIQIGANEMYKGDTAIPVDVPARVMNDRTMVPVRVIAEAFGADVDWNGNGNTVLISE